MFGSDDEDELSNGLSSNISNNKQSKKLDIQYSKLILPNRIDINENTNGKK